MANKIELLVNAAFPKCVLERPTYFDGKVYRVDARNFLTPEDSLLQRIAKENGWQAGTDHDAKMQKVWEYMRDNLRYEYDLIQKQRADHWVLPSIILQKGYDDCDGLASVLASLAMAARIPYYRIKIALGKVSKDQYAPTGGHAWVLFLNKNDEWEIWEATAKTLGRKGLAKELLGNSWYFSIYATFNLKHCFKQDSIETI